MKNKDEFKWELPQLQQHNVVCSGDIRIVNLPVRVLFEWSDKIVADYDSETDTVLEYTSGYVMKVIPNQQFMYKGEETIFIAQAMIIRNCKLKILDIERVANSVCDCCVPSPEYPEYYAYKYPVYSREEVLKLLKDSFPNKSMSGEYNISASKELRSFEEGLRKLGKSNAERILGVS